MSRRLLVIEPDATLRRVLEQTLSAAGYVTRSAPSVEAAQMELDHGMAELALVEIQSSNSAGLDGVSALRADYPELTLIAMSTLLTPRIMQDLLRARVDDFIGKPFTPGQLLPAVERALTSTRSRLSGGDEFAAALAAARRAMLEGRVRDAEVPLARAHAVSPFDADAMMLIALSRELTGEDYDADRGYRAALALGGESIAEHGQANAGLQRLATYAGARVVQAFEHRRNALLSFVDCSRDAPRPSGPRPDVVIFSLGLTPSETGAIYARLGAEQRGFLVTTSAFSERLLQRIVSAFPEPRVQLPHGKSAALQPPPAPQPASDPEPHTRSN